MKFNAVQIAAENKRARRAAKAVLAASREHTPTNHPGAGLARGGIRRNDREETRLAFDHGSAAAAKLRHAKDKSRRPRRAKAVKLPKPPRPDLSEMTCRERLAWMVAAVSEKRAPEFMHAAARRRLPA